MQSRQRSLLEMLKAKTQGGRRAIDDENDAHDDNDENAEGNDRAQRGTELRRQRFDNELRRAPRDKADDSDCDPIEHEEDREPSTSDRENVKRPRSRPSLPASILDRAVHSRFCPWSQRVLRNKHMAMYDAESTKMPLRLCGSLGIRAQATAAEVDSIGELLVVGCKGGHVLVNDVQSILEAAERVDGRGIEPGLHLRLGDGSGGSGVVNAVRWNPTDQNEIAVLCKSGILSMYDINRTRGEPSKKLSLPRQSKATDVVYFPSSTSTSGSGQYCVAVADERHGVLLFDSRTNTWNNGSGSKPLCVLKSDSQRHTGARCVSIVDSGRIVLAGGGRDLDGYMNMWDLRNVSSNVALTFSAAPNKHAHLRRLCLKTQLGRVHGLINESHFIPCTYPEFIRPDPASYYRVGVTMRCGWSAVLDLGRLELSHVHAPPARHAPSETWMDAMQEMDEAIMFRRAGDGGRVALPHEVIETTMATTVAGNASRSMGVASATISENKNVLGGCWLGESFVVPSATMDRTVHVVDFSGPCHSSGEEHADGPGGIHGFDGFNEVEAPSSVQLRVSHDAAGVLRVPGNEGNGHDALLSWGTDGTWNVLRPR